MRAAFARRRCTLAAPAPLCLGNLSHLPRTAPPPAPSYHAAALPMRQSFEAWTAPALGAQRLSAARPRTLIWFAVGAAAVPPTFVPSARPLKPPRPSHPTASRSKLSSDNPAPLRLP